MEKELSPLQVYLQGAYRAELDRLDAEWAERMKQQAEAEPEREPRPRLRLIRGGKLQSVFKG